MELEFARRKIVPDVVGRVEDRVERRRVRVRPVKCIFTADEMEILVYGKRAINEIGEYKNYSGQPDARIANQVSR